MKRVSCKRPFLLAILMITFIGDSFSQVYKSGPADKDFAGYLFAYFKGNAPKDEALESHQLYRRCAGPAYPPRSGWAVVLHGSNRHDFFKRMGFEPCFDPYEV